MRKMKATKHAPEPKRETSEELAQSLAALISRQMDVALEAVKCRQNELASLVACQLFDALDWARLNISRESPATLDGHILAHLNGPARQFRSLKELEEYAETHLSGAVECV